MAMVEPKERFPDPEDVQLRRRAEQHCLEAEQRCFRAERRRFEAERQRDQLQALLAEGRRAGLRMTQVAEELRRLVVSLRHLAERPAGLAAGDSPEGSRDASQAIPNDTPPAVTGDAMVDALSAAIARLRANVQAVGEPAGEHPDEPAGQPLAGPPTELAPSVPSPVISWQQAAMASPIRPVHKHSLSWIARWRMRRKQRRS